MTYNPGQFNNVVPFLPSTPDWFILGGPANGDEAQCAIKQWPNLKIIGIEPNREAIRWQTDNDWPRSGRLLPHALSNKVGAAVIRNEGADLLHASLESIRPGKKKVIPTTTIDSLHRIYGPFRNAILWLDIEGFELEALQGAKTCLTRGVFILINVEFLSRNDDKNYEIESLLHGHGFTLVHTWNIQPGFVEDRIYVRR